MTHQDPTSMLESQDAEIRRQGVVALRGITSQKVSALVLRALGDDDWRVRKEAVEIASGAAEALGLIESLVGAICQGENVGLRNASLDVLEALGPRAAGQLMRALPNVPEHARKFIVEALGESGGDAVVRELEEAATSGDANIAGEAIEALARIGGVVAERVMRSQLQSSEPFLRMAALDGLNRLHAVIPLAVLQPLLQDRLIRRVALRALGRSADPDAVALLLSALQESGAATQNAVVLSLFQLLGGGYELRVAVADSLSQADEHARASLRAVLERDDLAASRAAAQLLTLARDPQSVAGTMRLAVRDALTPATLEAFRGWGVSAVEPLLEAVESLEDPAGRAFALELAADLAALAGDMDGPRAKAIRATLRGALQVGEPRTAIAAARCMAAWALSEDATLLVRAAGDKDPEVSKAVGAALMELARREAHAVENAVSHVDLSHGGASVVPAVAALGGVHAFDRLQAAVTADDAETRRAAIAALAEAGGARAVELLALGLADEDRDVQAESAAALGRICDETGTPAGIDALVLALSFDASHVRAAAARALGETGGPQRAVDALAELVDDDDVGVAVAVVEALGRLAPSGLSRTLRRALSHPDSEVVKKVLPALVSSNAELALDPLIEALSHQAWDVRQLAAELIRKAGLSGARDALTRQLPHETDDLAAAAIQAALTDLGEEG